MKKILYIAILMLFGLSLYSCQERYIPPYRIGIVNNSNAVINRFYYGFSYADIYGSAREVPIVPERLTFRNTWQGRYETFAFKIYLDNNIVLDSMAIIESLMDDYGPHTIVDLIVNDDFTLTIKQYTVAD